MAISSIIETINNIFSSTLFLVAKWFLKRKIVK